MKKNTIKTLTLVTLILSLVFSINIVSFAASDKADPNGTITPTMVNSASLAFNRTSSSQAVAKVIASASGDTPYLISKITLQSSPAGANSYSNVTSNTKTVYTSSIFHTAYFTIGTSLDYRIKVDLTDEVDGIRLTTTYFKTLVE